MEVYVLKNILNLDFFCQNKAPFMNLMKYRKQSPVYLEDHDEYRVMTTNGLTTKNISRVNKILFNIIYL